MHVLMAAILAVAQNGDDPLKPEAVIDVWGKITAFERHPTRDVIYALDTSAHRILEVEVGQGGIARQVEVRDGAEAMALTPDGARLYVGVSTRGHRASVENEEGVLQVVDTDSFGVVKSLSLPLDPFQLVAGETHVVISGGSNAWTSLAVFDRSKESIVTWWKPRTSRGSFLRFLPGRKRIYSNDAHGSPQRVERWTVSGDWTKDPDHAEYRGRVDLGLADEFEITPDETHLICRSGIVLSLSDKPEEDLLPRFRLRREILGFAMAPGAGVFYVGDARGYLHEYDASTFDFRRSFFLDTKAYRMIVDRSGRFLYAAVYPGNFARHERGGPGDLAVFDLTKLPAVPVATEDIKSVKLDVPPPPRARSVCDVVAGDSQPCLRCEGKKTISWATIEDEVRTEYTRECSGCFGKGEVETIECPACGGYGQEYVHSIFVTRGSPLFLSEWIDCGRCKGTTRITLTGYAAAYARGTEEFECPTCRGKGKTLWDYQREGRTGKLEQDCDMCAAKGKIRMSECEKCKGSGLGLSDALLTVRGTPVHVNSMGSCEACAGTGIGIESPN